MNSDPYLPAEMGIDQGRGHFEPAADRGDERIVDFVEQTSRRHEAVADGLDLLEPVLRRNALEDHEQSVEPRYHLLRLVLVAIGREIGHVAEQNGHVLVAAWDH